jgi:hypothetical protein
MAVRLIVLWIVIAAIAAVGSWLLGRRAAVPTLWARVTVAAVLLAACAASYILFGSSLEKTIAGVAGYFLLWAGVFGLAAVCAGIAIGSLLALLLT